MKFFVGGCIFLMASMAFSQESITISRSNKLGVSVVDRLSKEGGKYFLNESALAKTRSKAAQEYWNLALKVKSSAECGAGKFVIIYDNGSKKSEIVGCPYGDEYGKLIAALYKLK